MLSHSGEQLLVEQILFSVFYKIFISLSQSVALSSTHIQEHSFTTQKYAEWSSLAHSAWMGIFKGEGTLKSTGDFKSVDRKKQHPFKPFNKTESSLVGVYKIER